MLNKEDLRQILEKGISEEQINRQLEEFRRGFPFLQLEGAATPGKGVEVLDETACEEACREWKEYQSAGHRVVKFVPASGAASRMFKNLFAFLNGDHEMPASDFEKEFFANIHHFAFFEELSDKCLQLEGGRALQGRRRRLIEQRRTELRAASEGLAPVPFLRGWGAHAHGRTPGGSRTLCGERQEGACTLHRIA